MGGFAIQYLIRDPQGNIFGPADEALLRQWVAEGRIVAGMMVAPRGSQDWVEVSRHPALADLLRPPAAPEGAVSSPANGLLPLSASQTSAGKPVVRRVEGGAPVELPYATPDQQLNVLALLSVIAGGLSMLMSIGGCCCIPLGESAALLLACTAIVLGWVALVQCKRAPERYTGRPMAVIGLILGAVALAIALLLIAFAVAMVVAGRAP